jgi:hypothetical protein
MSAFSDREKQVSLIILKGLKKGLSEARSLELAGMLLTPEVKKSIASTALLDVAMLLEDTKAQDIVPLGRSYSANDVKLSIAEWIRGVVADNDSKE